MDAGACVRRYMARTTPRVRCLQLSNASALARLQLAGTGPAGREGVAEVREQNLLLLRGTAHAILRNSLELDGSTLDLKSNFASQLKISFSQRCWRNYLFSKLRFLKQLPHSKSKL